ncbi:hypothetical protein AMTRI_Chr04g188640 [Amborella trichopoda]|uniref:Uncharacterized protein n=1 Tax=Amborella trichopoda TaxID=13333 RepID=W1NFF1_AMBTC|nr:uncharacterized protein LOC18421974 isoform X1 [Amborella trichopoda]XP_020520655.1 uncharacterized protein LOC18421974 isoform X1 [Amborella trichopoda]ERM94196.1 hypothetical protein AMTR_s00010p00190960 [Amborella trichopoda]|eukprot:XP_006826959.1 uncharacterized protein LOC18421974 isoform X1 [Amborella trichopoda]
MAIVPSGQIRPLINIEEDTSGLEAASDGPFKKTRALSDITNSLINNDSGRKKENLSKNWDSPVINDDLLHVGDGHIGKQQNGSVKFIESLDDKESGLKRKCQAILSSKENEVRNALDNIKGGESVIIFTQKDKGKAPASMVEVNLQSSSSSGGSTPSELSNSVRAKLPQAVKDHTHVDKDAPFNASLNANNEAEVEGCTCSYCIKVTNLLLDLHYQDAIGRLAALKKSKKDVRALISRDFNHDSTVNNHFLHSVAIPQSAKADPRALECTLMHQWKSLFLRTENALGHESSQLQTSLRKLNELRASYKNELGDELRDLV